jgi:Vacuolar protein sorting-associated protein 62
LTAASARLLAGAAAIICALANVQAGSASTAEQELADRYAPIVALKTPEGKCPVEIVTGEPWRPTVVEIVLGNPDVKLRGPGRGRPTLKQGPIAADLYERDGGYFLDFPGNPLNPGCIYERDGKRFAEGKPSVAYAHITTEAGSPGWLALEYWFYYYFNDFNNKHESDWEGIQLVFNADTVQEALQTEPVEVDYAQHEGGEWADWDDEKLERVGNRPVVYPAAGSHASYFSDRLWLGRSAAEGIGCDNSTGPSQRVELEAVVVPTEPASAEGRYAWLAYEGLWGQKERGPNNGPTGPNTKDRWTAPITWQEDLRQTSVAVPALPTFGPSVGSAFCAGVDFTADLFNNYLDDPVTTVLVVTGLLGLVLLLVLRTRWRPTAPEPIRARRGVGQILVAAARIYARDPLLFLAVGSVFIVLSAVPAGLLWLLDAFLSASVPVAPPLTLLSTVLVTATVAVVLRNLDSGRRLGAVKAIRFTLRRFWRLLGAALIALLVQLAIALTVIGIPWALYRFVGRIFVLNEVVLNGRSPRSSQGSSAALVRGNWWRTAILVALLYLVAIAVGPIVGFVLLFTTRLSPTLIDALGSVIYTVVFPYAAIAAALLYFELRERQREPKRAAPSSALRRALSLRPRRASA